MKTNKHQTLLLVNSRQVVRASDLVDAFHYAPGTARSYLSYLKRQGLLEPGINGYCLTLKGQLRLEFFGLEGCGCAECPTCRKRVSTLECPWCEHRQKTQEARIKPEWDFILGVRHAGVYCPECDGRILTEEDGLALGIRRDR